MGGIPTLLMMIAAAGVTYGWQPDKNGDDAGAVEYIVQVSPHELAQIERTGQLSSVIDPLVRGHVSRIVIRVGTGDLPRNTPDVLTAGRIASLKPDPQTGSFGLPPSLQESANNAASGAANQIVDQAGRTFQAGTNQVKDNLMDRLRGSSQDTASRSIVPPPSTRPTPSFTNSGSESPFATPRTGGPSTTPLPRDNQWNRLGTETPNRPSTSPAGQNGNTTAAGFTGGRDSSIADNGLRTTDMFGRMPAGLDPTDRAATTDNRTLATSPTNAQDGRIFSQMDQTRRDFNNGLAQPKISSLNRLLVQVHTLEPTTRTPSSRERNSMRVRGTSISTIV